MKKFYPITRTSLLLMETSGNASEAYMYCKMPSYSIIFLIKKTFSKWFYLLAICCCISFTASADYTVNYGTPINASTITGQSGILTINGTLFVDQNVVSLLNFTTIIINGPNGQIYWNGNYDLKFAAGISFDINNPTLGLQPTAGNGNASTRLIIGSTIIAVQSDNSNNSPFSFEEFNAAGGLPKFTFVSSPTSGCYGNVFTAILTPIDNYTNTFFQCFFSVNNGGGIVGPASIPSFNTPQTVTITPTNSVAQNTYTISCLIKRASDNDSIFTRTTTVIVNPTPAAPTLVSASASSICAGTSINLNATSGTDSIRWYTVATGGTRIGASKSPASFNYTPSVTATYYAETHNGTCPSTSRVNAGAVTVSPASVGGTVSGGGITVCTGSNTTNLSLSGNTGGVTRWESSLNNFATAGTTIVNNTTSLTVTNIAATTSYRALVKSGACDSAYSSSTTISVNTPGTWLGANTTWTSVANWCNGTIPTLGTNVFIGNGLGAYPVITGAAAVNNITIATGGTANVIINGGTLKVAGSVSSTNDITVGSGSVELAGTPAQSLRADYFTSTTLANLIISNTLAGASAVSPSVAINAAGGMLKISGTVSFGSVSGAFLKTNDNLTLLSSSSATASIADLTNNGLNTGNSISGNVVIERYIPGQRKWRLLTAPVTAASVVKISDAWQDGAPRVTDPAVINSTNNPNPGYGTHVTYGKPSPSGYDQSINSNSSIFYLTATGFNGVPTATNSSAGVNTGVITDQQGYLLFVRGNRSTLLSQGTAAATSPTVLRPKGNINQGVINVSLGNDFVSGTSHFRVVANPYPSAINFHKVALNASNTGAGIADAFYLWDPNLNGAGTPYGGWVAFSYNNANGNYDRNVVIDGTSGISNTGNIQSGTAFMINYSGAGIQIRESNKVSGSNNSQFRTVPPSQIRTTLLSLTAKEQVVHDAVLFSFDKSYNNAVDRSDMNKLNNFFENIAIASGNERLVIEKRQPLKLNDTLAFDLSRLSKKSYELNTELSDIDAEDGKIVLLQDNFLNKNILLNADGSTRYSFSINKNAASFNKSRFRMLIQPAVSFIECAVAQKEDDIELKWQTSPDTYIQQYVIEKSADGIDFTEAGKVESMRNDKAASYTWMTKQLQPGQFFYRVKSVNDYGKFIYSKPVNVTILSKQPSVSVFPNPVKGKIISIQFNRMPAGKYTARLINSAGSATAMYVIMHDGSRGTKSIKIQGSLTPALYRLQISGPDKKSFSLPLMLAGL